MLGSMSSTSRSALPPLSFFDFDLAGQLLPVKAGILLEHREEVDPRSNGGPGRTEIRLSDALVAVVHKGLLPVFGDHTAGFVAVDIHRLDFPKKHKKIFRCQARKFQDRMVKVNNSGALLAERMFSASRDCAMRSRRTNRVEECRSETPAFLRGGIQDPQRIAL